jgi:hypothetical protein
MKNMCGVLHRYTEQQVLELVNLYFTRSLLTGTDARTALNKAVRKVVTDVLMSKEEHKLAFDTIVDESNKEWEVIYVVFKRPPSLFDQNVYKANANMLQKATGWMIQLVIPGQ